MQYTINFDHTNELFNKAYPGRPDLTYKVYSDEGRYYAESTTPGISFVMIGATLDEAIHDAHQAFEVGGFAKRAESGRNLLTE